MTFTQVGMLPSFKGMEKMTNKWVSGYWLYDERERAHILKDYFPNRWFNVIPESIGMYTGFKAKFGIKLHDGDIFHLGDGIERCIRWWNGMFVAKELRIDYLEKGIPPFPLYRYVQDHRLIFIDTMYERGIR